MSSDEVSADSIISTFFLYGAGAFFLGAGFLVFTGAGLTVFFDLDLTLFLDYDAATFLNLGSFSASASSMAPPDSKTLSSIFYSAWMAEYSMMSWSTMSSFLDLTVNSFYSWTSAVNSNKLSLSGYTSATASTIMISSAAIASIAPPFRIYFTYRFIFNQIL